MTFDFHSISQSKKTLRLKLAARPIEEKLALLDILHERTVTLRRASTSLSQESCSPERVPVARLAAAQAALKSQSR